MDNDLGGVRVFGHVPWDAGTRIGMESAKEHDQVPSDRTTRREYVRPWFDPTRVEPRSIDGGRAGVGWPASAARNRSKPPGGSAWRGRDCASAAVQRFIPSELSCHRLGRIQADDGNLVSAAPGENAPVCRRGLTPSAIETVCGGQICAKRFFFARYSSNARCCVTSTISMPTATGFSRVMERADDFSTGADDGKRRHVFQRCKTPAPLRWWIEPGAPANVGKRSRRDAACNASATKTAKQRDLD